jgi:hypothetical protein
MGLMFFVVNVNKKMETASFCKIFQFFKIRLEPEPSKPEPPKLELSQLESSELESPEPIPSEPMLLQVTAPDPIK